MPFVARPRGAGRDPDAPLPLAADARVTRVDRLGCCPCPEPEAVALVLEAAAGLRRLGAGSKSASSSSSWSISAEGCRSFVAVAMVSRVSSSSAAWRPRLSVVARFGCSGAVEDEAEPEAVASDSDSGMAVFDRVVRCCFGLAFALVLVVVAVRDEGGSEPMVAMVEALLSEEASLVVDPMVAMVEVLLSDGYTGTSVVVEVEDSMLTIVEVRRSEVCFGTLLNVEVEASKTSAMAYVLYSPRRMGGVDEEVDVGGCGTGVLLRSSGTLGTPE